MTSKERPIYEVESQMTVEVPEHQFLLSFNGDEDCVIFNDWWMQQGQRSFEAYWRKAARR